MHDMKYIQNSIFVERQMLRLNKEKEGCKLILKSSNSLFGGDRVVSMKASWRTRKDCTLLLLVIKY